MFQKTTFLMAILSFLLISFGAFVRLNGAGLSCPDWPLCYGKLIPPEGYKIALEVGHRAVAVLLGFGYFIMMILCYRSRLLKDFRKLAVICFGLVCFQGILGGLTVILLLNPIIVMLHLIGGNLLLWLTVYLYMQTKYGKKQIGHSFRQSIPFVMRKNWVILMNGLFLVLLISGGLNSATNSGSFCEAFPGCKSGSFFSFTIFDINLNGHFLPLIFNEWIHMAHRLIVISGSIFLIFLSFQFWVRSKLKSEKTLGILIIATLLIEITIGAINALFLVPIPVSALHTSFAALLSILFSISFYKSRYQSQSL